MPLKDRIYTQNGLAAFQALGNQPGLKFSEGYARGMYEPGDEKQYNPTPMTTGQMVGAGQVGWTPEAIEMVNRLTASGLDQNLALVAVEQMMGMNSSTQAPPIPAEKPKLTPEQEWAQYEKDAPIRAHAKKLLTVGSAPARDLGKAIVKGASPEDVKGAREKAAAAKMLREYVQSQDARRAGEENRDALWMMARMPGAPLAGQPIYTGPTPELNPPLGPNDLNIGPARIKPLDVDVGPVRINTPQARRK